MKRRCVFYSIFAGFAPISRAPLVRSRREDHIPHPESGHHLVLMISCFQIPPRERRPESTPLPCNLGTARAPPPYAENAPISRAPLVRSRREDHIPHLGKHTPIHAYTHTHIHAYTYTLAKGRWRVPPTNLSSSMFSRRGKGSTL